jgi:ketosteroid isomerase-like protein
MLDHATVATWLEAYSHAWQTNDPAEIGELFSEDAVYHYHPYAEPVRGREAIVASWLGQSSAPGTFASQPDAPGTFASRYEPLVVEGNRAVANGRSRYFEADGVTAKTEFDNIFVLRFDDDGRCSEYREWYVERPNPQ